MADSYPSPPTGQAARYSVSISDGQNADFAATRRSKGSGIANGISAGNGTYEYYSGLQRKYRMQIEGMQGLILGRTEDAV